MTKRKDRSGAAWATSVNRNVNKALAQERKALEAAVWRKTGKDYRSVFEGKKSVLVNGPQGTTLTPLSSLSIEQLRTLAR
jgi:hypothetical protein